MSRFRAFRRLIVITCTLLGVGLSTFTATAQPAKKPPQQPFKYTEAEREAAASQAAKLFVEQREIQHDAAAGWRTAGEANRLRQALIKQYNDLRNPMISSTVVGPKERSAYLLLEKQKIVQGLTAAAKRTTIERRQGKMPRTFGGQQQNTLSSRAVSLDRSSWLDDFPGVDAVVKQYPPGAGEHPLGIKPGEVAPEDQRAASALRVLLDALDGYQYQETLTEDRIRHSYELALLRVAARHERDHTSPGELVALAKDDGFKLEVLKAFMPRLAANVEYKADKRAQAKAVTRSTYAGIYIGFALAGAFIVFSIVSWWKDRSLIEGFTIDKQGDTLEVSYQPGRHHAGTLILLCLLWWFLLPLIGFLFEGCMNWNRKVHEPRKELFQNPSVMTNFLVTLIYVGGPAIWLGTLNWLRRKRRRFTITPDAFVVNGKSYDRERIDSIFLYHIDAGSGQTITHTKRETRTIWVYGDPATIGYLAASQAVGNAMRAGQEAAHAAGNIVGLAMRKVCWKVCFNFGEHRKTLASGLGQRRAEALFARLAQALEATAPEPTVSGEAE